MIMSYLETEDGKCVQEIAAVSMGDKKVDELLESLQTDRNSIHKVIPLLPEDIYNYLTGDEFIEVCRSRFAELDVDSNGVLDAVELVPVVVAISKQPDISIESCLKFVEVFDMRGDGVIRIDEFLDFARFIEILGYLNSKSQCP